MSARASNIVTNGSVVDGSKSSSHRKSLVIRCCKHSFIYTIKNGNSFRKNYTRGDYSTFSNLYTFNDNGFPVAYNGVWLAKSAISKELLSEGWEQDALERWLDPRYIRGKGLSQAASRVDQFAY